MKNHAILIFISACLAGKAQEAALQPSVAEFTLQPHTHIQLVSPERGVQLLTTADTYTSSLSEFDVQVRLQSARAKREADYLRYAGKQFRPWEPEEIEEFAQIIEFTNQQLEKLNIKLNLPPLIEVIKTTGKEEGGAGGYTRGRSIILNRESVNDFTFVHELCHIMLRYNPELRDTLYATMGFNKCSRIAYPPMIYEQKLTNPDAPFMEHYITVNYLLKPQDVTLFIYSDQPYSSGSLFEYLQIGLLMLTGPDDNKQVVFNDDGSPRILAYDDVQELYEQIGRNTGYNIHPEELTASHFTIMMFEKTGRLDKPDLITAMHDILVSWKK